MGQARRRGTFEERVEQAVAKEAEQRRLREIREVIERSTKREVVRIESTPGRMGSSAIMALLAASALSGGRR
jgi:hypothetical protein